MQNVSKNHSEPNNSRQTVHLSQIDKLTKSQLVEILNGSITQPLAPENFYRCAASVLHGWCNDVLAGRYASMYDLTRKLEVLQSIYQNK